MSSHQENIDALKLVWDSLQPLSSESENRLWKKIRLEWNYHSNHIEGNTLSYGETELLLIHDQTNGNHALRDYEEMKAHDVGIAYVKSLASDSSRNLSESDIRSFNKIILKEPYWKVAQTDDGKPSRREIIPGDYKTSPNNVLTASGEYFEFALPSDVPVKMNQLVIWLDSVFEDAHPDVAAAAAKLHHDFVLIHPFDDGNGRVARMLVNYLLIRLGYPPIVVPSGEKQTYLAALRMADAGDRNPLTEYLAGLLEKTLKMAINAGKGSSIEEEGDIEKEIAIFIRNQEGHKEKVKQRSADVIRELYNTGFRELLVSLTDKMNSFNPLFLESQRFVEPGSPSNNTDPIRCFEGNISSGFKNQKTFQIRFIFSGYRGEAKQPFNVQQNFSITFRDFNYVVMIGDKKALEKLYSEPVLADETKDIVESVLKMVFAAIKKKSNSGE